MVVIVMCIIVFSFALLLCVSEMCGRLDKLLLLCGLYGCWCYIRGLAANTVGVKVLGGVIPEGWLFALTRKFVCFDTFAYTIVVCFDGGGWYCVLFHGDFSLWF